MAIKSGLAVALSSVALSLVRANQYDVFFPKYHAPAECTDGCARWADLAADGVKADQTKVAALFANSTIPDKAGAQCAMPGSSPVHGEGRRLLQSTDFEDSWMWELSKSAAENGSVPICFCKNSKGAFQGYCTPPMSVPEQINLQYAAADIVVAAFVTYEKSLPKAPPVASFGVEGGKPTQLTGISHWYTNGDRNYTLNFVKFSGLKPATRYTYKVKSGAANGEWSDSFTFRSVRAAPETRIAMYGDMGVSEYNDMANLLVDCQAGRIDVFAHMGDHCYNMGMQDDRKGDAYMNALQPLTATCPWIPIIGNHEASDGDHTHRYLNLTWGEAWANPLENMSSSATSALGHVITKGNFLGAGLHGTTPSGTSNYFSVDVGNVHIAAMSTISPKGDELAWLEKDLAAADANRKNVPWIIVTSHYQIYLSSKMERDMDASYAYYNGEGGEFSPNPEDAFRSCAAAGESPGCRSVGDALDASAATLDPLFTKYKVDIYNAGHAHEYGVTWPIVNGSSVQKDYIDPKGTVYITEGNGGVPGVGATHKFNKPSAEWARIHGTGGAYGRLLWTNRTVMTYEHVWNNGNNGTGEVMETWAIQSSQKK